MKTANLISDCLIDSSNGIKPEVGMGITICQYTDRKAGTITRVSTSGKTFWFKYDIAKRIDNYGMSDCQDYEYTEDPNSWEQKASLRKDGCFRVKSTGYYVALNRRDAFHDFSF